jgi:hypothetical protein
VSRGGFESLLATQGSTVSHLGRTEPKHPTLSGLAVNVTKDDWPKPRVVTRIGIPNRWATTDDVGSTSKPWLAPAVCQRNCHQAVVGHRRSSTPTVSSRLTRSSSALADSVQ